MMQLHVATFSTPCGPFSVAVNEAGAVVATAFGELPALRARLPQTFYLLDDTPELTAPVQREVREYFARELRRFTLTLAAHGSAFQHRVWADLTAIPFGQTRSYGQVAAALGQPGAAQAVGQASGSNPIALLVPCHRVIGAKGALGGFAFGVAIKQQLLRHEGAPRVILG